MTDKNNAAASTTPLAAYLLVAGFSAIIGFGAIYAIVSPADKRPFATAAPANRNAGGDQIPSEPGNRLATGEMVRFVHRATLEAVPPLPFEDAQGTPRSLADFKGKVVLLNLWATWCAPCVKEMPSLDRLQSELGGTDFMVVALSVDQKGAGAVATFFQANKIEKLGVSVDTTMKALKTLKISGLPTTILIDRDGREIGRLAGPAEWDSPEAKWLIQTELGSPSQR